jgi:hypothetical protein
VKAASLVAAGIVALTISISMVACSDVASLDVAYVGGDGGDGGKGDGGGGTAPISRDGGPSPSSEIPILFDGASPTALGPCNGGLGADAGCDDTEGLGCCLDARGSTCMEQAEAPLRCAGNVFVACRQSEPDSPCCWRTVSGSRMAVYAGDCGEDPIACIDSNGCPLGQGCATKQCGDPSHAFTIGACGSVPPDCP